MAKFPIRQVEEICSTFPLTDGKIAPIMGEPTAKELLRVHTTIRACAKSQPSKDSNFGHSFLAKPPAIMATYGEAPFIHPTRASVGPQPNYTSNFLQAQMETTCDTWDHRNAHCQNINNVDKALIIEFLKTIPADIIKDVETNIDTAQDMTFLQVFNLYWSEYGHLTQYEVTENRNSMETPWNLVVGENFTKVIHQIRDGQCFATYTGNEFTNKQLVTMGEKIIIDSGCFKSAYSKWMEVDEALKTWPNFITHFTVAYKIWKVTDKAASKFGYGGAANEQGSAGDEASWEDHEGINAAINTANAATFQQLSSTNATLTSQNAQLYAQVNFLQQQLQQ